MKYIKTKDNIVEVDFKKVWKTLDGNLMYSITKEPYVIKNTEFIRGADTIEELCDCFICISPNNKGILLAIGPEHWKDEIIEKDNEYYGAILVVKKGLKCVAKLNEKGEFELI